MYLITQGSVFKRTYQAASVDFIIFPRFSRFHVLQLFMVQLSSFYPPYCREDVGRKTHEVYSKRMTQKDHGLRKKRTRIGSEKRASVYTLEKKGKSGYGTDFYPSRSEKGP